LKNLTRRFQVSVVYSGALHCISVGEQQFIAAVTMNVALTFADTALVLQCFDNVRWAQ